MKILVVVCFLGLVVFAAARYTDKYDAINVDEILESPRAFQAYIKCVLDLGKCSPDGKELKSHLQEVLQTHCAECTHAQIKISKRVMDHLINKEPEIWNKICEKYDPQRLRASTFEKELRKN